MVHIEFHSERSAFLLDWSNRRVYYSRGGGRREYRARQHGSEERGGNREREYHAGLVHGRERNGIGRSPAEPVRQQSSDGDSRPNHESCREGRARPERARNERDGHGGRNHDRRLVRVQVSPNAFQISDTACLDIQS